MSNLRTFIAIEIPDAIQTKIAQLQEELKPARESISWTKAHKIHLTLKFLGEVEETLLPDIIKEVTSVCTTQTPFDFEIKNMGCFPNPRRARVVWVGTDNPGQQLSTLAKNIEDCLIQFGFSKENRKFNPHLTIGRVKSPLGESFIETIKAKSFYGGRITAAEIAVIKSDLKPTGAVYTPLAILKLENTSLKEGRK
jgi:2'-5' RNA ligase